MKNDYYIIYNPVSSSGKSHKIFNKFSTYLNQQSIPFQSIKSEYKGHIQKICQSIDIYNYVIIIGGDGTIHEAINGLMLNPNLEQMTIGFLPGGTGNSFLHDL